MAVTNLLIRSVSLIVSHLAAETASWKATAWPLKSRVTLASAASAVMGQTVLAGAALTGPFSTVNVKGTVKTFSFSAVPTLNWPHAL